jgi:hypothetical protein
VPLPSWTICVRIVLLLCAGEKQEVRERFARIDHRGSYVQMHFALDGVPGFAAPYDLLSDPSMQAAIGLFSTPQELRRQLEDCRHGAVPADPAIAFQLSSCRIPAWRRPASTRYRRSRSGSRSIPATPITPS